MVATHLFCYKGSILYICCKFTKLLHHIKFADAQLTRAHQKRTKYL